MGGHGRRGSAALVVAGLLAVVVGVVWWVRTDPAPASTGVDRPAAAGTPAPARTTPAPATPAAPAASPASPARAPHAGEPTRVRIPDLGVDAPVVPVSAPGRTLVPPADPQRLGWWADGARPGAVRGSALVTGHTVHTGGGALDDLETLTPGDRVDVRTEAGPIRYAVQRVRTYSKGRIAADAERLFSQSVPGRLVLITCEDWDGTRYLSNVVVVATPV